MLRLTGGAAACIAVAAMATGSISAGTSAIVVKQVVTGADHTCALIAGGTVKCWGANNFGQVGDGTDEDRSKPVVVKGLAGVKKLVAGQWTTCAWLAKGVKCWGNNTYGELADGTKTERRRPATVKALAGVKAIAPGFDHACGLWAGGTVKCWGSNARGQLGTGTGKDSLKPVAVRGLSGVTALASGETHTCAIVSGGKVMCWGEHSSELIGDTPRTKTGISGAKQIVAGSTHTCVLASGSARCWGGQPYGQLGNGSTTTSSSPVVAAGLGRVKQLTAGSVWTCALITGGTVYCWGNNRAGSGRRRLDHGPAEAGRREGSDESAEPGRRRRTQLRAALGRQGQVLGRQSLHRRARRRHGRESPQARLSEGLVAGLAARRGERVELDQHAGEAANGPRAGSHADPSEQESPFRQSPRQSFRKLAGCA